jgi:hypothetical protein
MARTRQGSEFEIEVDGETYLWWLHRQPQWSSDPSQCRGMAIAVRLKEGRREAVLEFPPGQRPRYGAPQLQPAQISRELVATAIASAVAAGWEPMSRGKTVSIVVDATGR